MEYINHYVTTIPNVSGMNEVTLSVKLNKVVNDFTGGRIVGIDYVGVLNGVKVIIRYVIE